MNMKLKKRINNKGFTLVELIIVIAIIAVLAAVLAPRYLQYVERSRQSNDLQVATNLMRATTAAVVDQSVRDDVDAGYEIHWRTDRAGDANFNNATFAVLIYNPATGVATGSQDVNLRNDIAQIMGWADETGVYNDADDLVDNGQSSIAQTYRFTFTIDTTTGEITVNEHFSGPWVDEIGVNVDLNADGP